MSLVKSMFEFSFKPFSTAESIIKNHKNSTCSESITARLLFVAQIIVSAIALPIILVVGLISAMINACQCKENEDLRELLIGSLTTILGISLSVGGIFTPLSASNCVREAIDRCLGYGESNNDNSQGTVEDVYQQDQEWIAG